MSDRLTAEQAANILGYHIGHMRRLLRMGTVRAEQFNGVWIIDRQEVERIKALQGPGGRLPKTEHKQSNT